MRLGFSTQEAYFTILGVLIVLSAIGTIIGNWLVSRAQGNETRLNNLRVVNSRVRASWPLLIVFAIAFCLGEAALLIFFAFASFFALREFIALTPTRRHDHVILIIAFYICNPRSVHSSGIRRDRTLFSVYPSLLIPDTAGRYGLGQRYRPLLGPCC